MPNFFYEQHYGGIVAGVDEAGRGPLAGPVVAAAVILKHAIVGLDDSKKLSSSKRAALYAQIIKENIYTIAVIEHEQIDIVNILNATKLAMQEAINKLPTCDHILIDGNQLPHVPGQNMHAIIGGDGKSCSIAAASIIAKEWRDAYMLKQSLLYPEYGFAQHKGYGTKQHIAAILQYGPCPIHRKTFLRKIIDC